jgi:Ca2+-transporting ATPase
MTDANNNAEPFHSLPPKKVLDELSTGLAGLSKGEAKNRYLAYGPNEIPEKKATNPLLIFIKQFHSILIYILLIAALISFFIGHIIDVYVIVGIVLINATMGFLQERKAEKSIRALKKMIVPYSKVFREGGLVQMPSRELVPGDMIFLEEGDRIAADARLLEIKNFRTIEASLTGESLPITKFVGTLPEKTGLADRRNMVWMGTFVAAGEAKAVVTSTGVKTALGRISESLEKIKRVKGHFEKKTDILAKQMGVIAAVGASFTFLVGFFVRKFEFSEIFLFTLAVLISGIPEGLPAVLVIVLAIGANRMANRNAIIRTLPTTETLGVASAIATDKTGTLTQNTMNVKKIILPDEEEITISGEGWNPTGNFSQATKIILPLENRKLSKLLHIGAICTNARIVKEEEKRDSYKIIGDPTEAALVVLSEKAGLKKEVLLQRETKIDDLPFNPDLKYRASLSLQADNINIKEICVVGAPEAVLEKTQFILGKKGVRKIKQREMKELIAETQGLARQAMRVLALAYKEVPADVDSLQEPLVNELILVGIVGMMDPPRPEVKEAVAKARKAGIRVIMKTGDHKETAVAIAKEIGLIDNIDPDEVESIPTETGEHPVALTEQELLNLSENEFDDAVSQVSIFARLTPNMKLRIVETLQKQGHVVAMSGDGINDAPALKKADIGIAMGVIGTDVARESSDIVLADDNFASIMSAIEEGRTVFTNTRQASLFLISTNFAEAITIISTLLLGFPLPLLPTQILWLNLVTDGVSDIALATEPSHEQELEYHPRRAAENILSKETLVFVLIMAIAMVIFTISVFRFFLPSGIEKARTGAFTVMAFTQLFNVLNMRSLNKSIFKVGFLTNKFIVASLSVSVVLLAMVLYVPFFQGVFQFSSLSLIELGFIILLSSFVFWLGELYKRIKNKYHSTSDKYKQQGSSE